MHGKPGDAVVVPSKHQLIYDGPIIIKYTCITALYYYTVSKYDRLD